MLADHTCPDKNDAFFLKASHKKIRPSYSRELEKYPNISVVLIATAWKIVNFFKRLNNICLFCEEGYTYDLACCHQREVWILYADSEKFGFANHMGLQTQIAGATKTYLIKVEPALLKTEGEKYE